MKNEELIRRFRIERKKFDRSGIYAYTQRTLAYNSNKIEGSTLNEEQTASLFDTGMLPRSDDYYRAKDVEETNGHFLMFNKMIDTLDEPLSEELIKAFHFELKSGVFEDRANGYAIGIIKSVQIWWECMKPPFLKRCRKKCGSFSPGITKSQPRHFPSWLSSMPGMRRCIPSRTVTAGPAG